VVPGCARPLLRATLDAREVHGEGGLGAARLPAAQAAPTAGHAVDYLIETIGAAPGEITLIATGPLTNIALAVRREPRLVGWVRDFVIMGGSAARGNVTPAAEFNIVADPEAAAIVFEAGWQVTMVGLDVTLQARATPDVQDRMRGLGRLGADLLLPGLLGYRGEPAQGDASAGGAPVHDVCALALVAEPGLFGCDPARVDVETAGRWTTGMTVTDFSGPAEARNALVAMRVDGPAFWDLVLSAYAKIPAASPAS
jgi:purine nucleosidase